MKNCSPLLLQGFNFMLVSYSPGASKTDRTCWCDGLFLSILLLIKRTQKILLLSPEKSSYIPGISLDQIGEKTKINVLWKGKGVCQTNARSKVEE